MTWLPLYDLKLSHSLREIMPPRTATAVDGASLDIDLERAILPERRRGAQAGGKKRAECLDLEAPLVGRVRARKVSRATDEVTIRRKSGSRRRTLLPSARKVP
jgi:hypothetical protein